MINPITGLEEDEYSKIFGQADTNRQKIIDEGNEYDTTGAVTGALASLGAAFQGKDSMAAASQVMGQRKQNRKDELSALDKWKEGKLQEIAAKREGVKIKRDDELFAKESDPNSMESKMANELAASMGYKGAPITAAQFKAFSPALQKKYEIAERGLDRKEARDERRFQSGIKMNERREIMDDKMAERKERQIDQDMQKLSKDVSGTQGMLGALDEVEMKLGGPLESFQAGGDKLTKDGKEIDLPGVSIPGIGRTTFYSNEGRSLNSAASRVFNSELKDRSGGAVTDNEMERLRKEFNEGKYNTEPELIDALQRYKRQTEVVLKNREAAYTPEVVAKYTDQGGRTSQTLRKSSSNASGKTVVKTQTNPKTGQKRVVYNDGSTEVINAVAGGR